MSEAAHGEDLTHYSVPRLKQRLATIIGSDPSRYDAGLGTRANKLLTIEEYRLIADALGLPTDGTRHTLKEAIYRRVDRSHRVGARAFDSSDLRVIIQTLENTDQEAA